MPDWEGLDVIVNARINQRGKAEVLSFSDWLAQVQKDRAFTLKQSRLLREENNHDRKRKGQNDKDE